MPKCPGKAEPKIPRNAKSMPIHIRTLPSQVRRYDEELRQAIASTVGGAMESEFPSLLPDASIEDAATLMHESDITHVVILDGGKPAGIVARGDLVRFLARSS